MECDFFAVTTLANTVKIKHGCKSPKDVNLTVVKQPGSTLIKIYLGKYKALHYLIYSYHASLGYTNFMQFSGGLRALGPASVLL